MKPRLLDLFCGAGGAAMGYHRAGFEVVGVDVKPQPNYPFRFIEADALEVLAEGMELQFDPWSFDVIHASPPCQFATVYRNHGRVGDHENLIPQTRTLLEGTGLPYMIENVEGARTELKRWAMLCGSMFEPPLDVRRHRYFETNWGFLHPHRCRHGVWKPDRFPGGRSKERTGSNRGLARATVEIGTWDIPLDTQQRAMGIDWMPLEELSEAHPARLHRTHRRPAHGPPESKAGSMTPKPPQAQPRMPETLDSEKRARFVQVVRARLEAATPGPWIIADSEIWGIRSEATGDDVVMEVCDEKDVQGRADAYLLVMAPDLAVEFLAAEQRAEEAERERDALRKTCEDVLAFVRTGGPLNAKDRLELIAFVSADLAAPHKAAEEEK